MRQLVSRMMCCTALLLLPSAVFAATSLVTVSYLSGVDVGTVTDATITLTNTNTLYPLKINSINNFTANASLNASITTNGCKNATLPVGGTCTFTVRFNSPTTQGVGAFSFSLSANNRIYPQVYSEPVAVFKEYTLTNTANPRSIVVDNSGTVWFTEYGVGKIGIITNGVLSECNTLAGGTTSTGLASIALDPTNSLVWITELFSVGGSSDFASISATSFTAGAACAGYTRYTPTLTPVTSHAYVNLAVVPGTPESVWVANFFVAGGVTANQASLFYDSTGTPGTLGAQYYYNNPPSYNTYVNPWALVVGHDTQHIWFTDKGNDSVGKLQIASPNSIVEYPINTSVQTNDPQYIVLGSNNQLWVTSWYNNAVVQVTTTGTITKSSVPTATSKPNGIAADAAGDIWFAEMGPTPPSVVDKIGTFNLSSCTTTACTMTEYDIPTSMVNPYAIAIDPNNSAHIWFTESDDPSSGGMGATISKIGELITTPLP